MKLILKENLKFYKSAWLFIIPVTLQAVVETILGLMNTFLVGQFGHDDTVAGVACSSNVYDLVWCIFFAIVAAGNIFLSQYQGVNDQKRVKETTNLKLFYVLLFSVFCLVYFEFLSHWTSALILGGQHDNRKEAIDVATEYSKLVAWNYPFLGFAYIISITMNASGNVKTPLIVSSCSLVINVVLACVLSFPYQGSFNLGIKGLAFSLIATRVVECCLFIGYLWYKKPNYAPNLNIFRFSRNLHWRYLKAFIPIFFSQVFFGFSIVIQTVIFAYFGNPSVVAAANIVSATMAIFYSTYRGYNALVSHDVGQKLGRGQFALAKENAKKILQFCFLISLICSMLIVVSAFIVPRFLFVRLSPAALDIATKYLAYSAITFFFINMLQPIFSFLYAGGYTLIVSVADLILIWVIDIFVIFALLKWAHLEITMVMLISCLTKIIDFAIAYIMYRSIPWAKNLIKLPPKTSKKLVV